MNQNRKNRIFPIIGVVASLITIFVFATGHNSLLNFFNEKNEKSPTPVHKDTLLEVDLKLVGVKIFDEKKNQKIKASRLLSETLKKRKDFSAYEFIVSDSKKIENMFFNSITGELKTILLREEEGAFGVKFFIYRTILKLNFKGYNDQSPCAERLFYHEIETEEFESVNSVTNRGIYGILNKIKIDKSIVFCKT